MDLPVQVVPLLGKRHRQHRLVPLAETHFDVLALREVGLRTEAVVKVLEARPLRRPVVVAFAAVAARCGRRPLGALLLVALLFGVEVDHEEDTIGLKKGKS